MWLEMTSSLPTTSFGEELQFIPPWSSCRDYLSAAYLQCSSEKCNYFGRGKNNYLSIFVIYSFSKALELSPPVSLESDGQTTTIRLTKKLRRGATKSHPYAARNPDNGAVVGQSKAIQKHLYIRRLELYYKSK